MMRIDVNNIILIGMPRCGKTTIGKSLSKRLCKKFIDMDDLIVDSVGLSIEKIFAIHGEKYFRDIESRLIYNLNSDDVTNCVIATGGGVILRPTNISMLKNLGIIIFLDRPLNLLLPSDVDSVVRPLAKSSVDVQNLYNARYQSYIDSSDVIVKNNLSIDLVVNKICGVLDEDK